MPMVFFIIVQIINDTINTNATTDNTPSNCDPKLASALVKGTTKVPHIPATKCAGIAPTTSSILN